MHLNRRYFLAGILAFSCLFGMPHGGLAETMIVKHAQGETEVPLNPKRVVVFDLGVLDLLNSLDIPVTGIPTGPKPEYLQAYNDDKYAKVGTLFEPNYEAVNALSPDIILLGARSASKLKDLSKIAPTLDLSYDPSKQIGSIVDHAKLLGQIFGKTEEVAEQLATIDAKLKEVRTATASAGTGQLILTTGGRMSAFGPGSRFGLLYDEFGITPSAPALDIGTHGQAISNEFLLETNPDWLFVLDRDAAIGHDSAAARTLLDNAIMHRTTAWKQDHIVYLSSDAWYLGGGGIEALLRSMDDILLAMRRP